MEEGEGEMSLHLGDFFIHDVVVVVVVSGVMMMVGYVAKRS